MVTLVCAVVGQKGSEFAVEIEENKLVDDLKKAIKQKNERTITCDAQELKLYLGKTKDNKWLTQKQLEEGISDMSDFKQLKVVVAPLQLVGLSEKDVAFKLTMEDVETMNTLIHVLVVVPEVDQGQWSEERAPKKARTGTTIEVEKMDSIEATLDIDEWQIGGIELDIHQIEPDFPKWFYVRKETQDIINIFLTFYLSIVFMGSPGVGKSMLVVLFAFYMALQQQKVVVLLRKLKGKGFSMLYMAATCKC
jgi:Crinkler effector protein N-terminal domain